MKRIRTLINRILGRRYCLDCGRRITKENFGRIVLTSCGWEFYNLCRDCELKGLE